MTFGIPHEEVPDAKNINDWAAWYREQLKSPKWKAKAKDVYKRDDFKCQDCLEQGNLEDGVKINAHHEYYIQGKLTYPWNYPMEAYITVCDACHEKRHEKTIVKYKDHEEAYIAIWSAISEEVLARVILEEHLEERSKRIDRIYRLGGIWNSEGRFFSWVDKRGKDCFADEDGEIL